MNILCVCTGNICRSPMLAALLSEALPREGITDCTVTSAGLATMNDLPASAHALTAMREIGKDISEHRSRQLTPEIAADTDIFVALSLEHGVTLAFQYDADPERIVVPGGGIPDPYGGDLTTYRLCRDALIQTLPQLVQDIRNLL